MLARFLYSLIDQALTLDGVTITRGRIFVGCDVGLHAGTSLAPFQKDSLYACASRGYPSQGWRLGMRLIQGVPIQCAGVPY